MRTLVISDLHLGAASGADVLRRPAVLDALLEAVRGTDRLVILGDALELRDGPERDVLRLASPFFAAVGEALGADGELLLLAGNHDHGLISGWVDGRLQTEAPGFLGLEQRIGPGEAGRVAARLAELASPARVSLAYPGVWLRDDVYATHGHYCDVHSTVPTFERLAAGVMGRLLDAPADPGATPDDYEALLSPLYAWIHAVAQRSRRERLATGTGASARAWMLLSGGTRRVNPVKAAAARTGFAAAVAAINAAGLGPVRRDISGAALRQGGLHGIREALRRLGVAAPYVIWGHSHRSGPWPADDPAEWTTAAGGRILNTGSWTFQRHFVTDRPNESPYWPGTAIEIDDDGTPPRLVRLLGDRGHAELTQPA